MPKQKKLFGTLNSGIKGSQKQHIWREITIAVNIVGMGNRSTTDVSVLNFYIHDSDFSRL